MKKKKAKVSSNRQMSVTAAAAKVAKLTKLGVKASIVPEGGGKFRIELWGKSPKKKRAKVAKKAAPKKKARRKVAKKKKASKKSKARRR